MVDDTLTILNDPRDDDDILRYVGELSFTADCFLS